MIGCKLFAAAQLHAPTVFRALIGHLVSRVCTVRQREPLTCCRWNTRRESVQVVHFPRQTTQKCLRMRLFTSYEHNSLLQFKIKYHSTTNTVYHSPGLCFGKNGRVTLCPALVIPALSPLCIEQLDSLFATKFAY